MGPRHVGSSFKDSNVNGGHALSMAPDPMHELCAPPAFHERLCSVSRFLSADYFAALQAEIRGLAETARTYIPTHKKGATIGYDVLRNHAPRAVGLYQNAQYQQFLAAVVGVRLEPTPAHDNSSLSVLIYDQSGDHIGWHYDHNFYRGRHFTVLIGIENANRDGTGLSEAKLLIRKTTGEEIEIRTAPNTLVVFEGSKVLHKVTPIGEGERRTILSMTYCTDSRNTHLQELARKIKDTAFFGARALWN